LPFLFRTLRPALGGTVGTNKINKGIERFIPPSAPAAHVN
jgi:hypothetical protein